MIACMFDFMLSVFNRKSFLQIHENDLNAWSGMNPKMAYEREIYAQYVWVEY